MHKCEHECIYLHVLVFDKGKYVPVYYIDTFKGTGVMFIFFIMNGRKDFYECYFDDNAVLVDSNKGSR